jgi:hypothetical protein
MATGDATDIGARLRALLPSNWFPNGPQPVLDSVLAGPSAAFAWAYGLLTWTGQQLRLATSQGGMLDLFAYDFFGTTLPRRSGEADTPYILRIGQALFAPRVTRYAMGQALYRLTGRSPWIFEPFLPIDTGGYFNPANPTVCNGLAYGVAGRYGSLALPAQCFVIAFRPKTQGIAYVAGYGNPEGAYGIGATEYLSEASDPGTVQDSEILATINATKAAGVVVWTQIQS